LRILFDRTAKKPEKILKHSLPQLRRNVATIFKIYGLDVMRPEIDPLTTCAGVHNLFAIVSWIAFIFMN